MADKPSISRSTSKDAAGLDPGSSHSPDRSQLAQLYPDPKTYDQKIEDDKLRQQAYRHRWPKYPHLTIAAYGSILFGLLIWFGQNIGTWWVGSSDRITTISSVFFSFALGLGIMLLLVAWVNYINKQFSYFGGMIGLFWLIYGVFAMALLILWLSGLLWQYTNALWIPVSAVTHFIIVFFVAWRILKPSRVE